MSKEGARQSNLLFQKSGLKLTVCIELYIITLPYNASITARRHKPNILHIEDVCYISVQSVLGMALFLKCQYCTL